MRIVVVELRSAQTGRALKQKNGRDYVRSDNTTINTYQNLQPKKMTNQKTAGSSFFVCTVS